MKKIIKIIILVSVVFVFLNPLFCMGPFFIGNVPTYVDSETETETTSLELEEEIQYTEEDFDDPPFSTTWFVKKGKNEKLMTTQGRIVPGFLYKSDDTEQGGVDIRSTDGSDENLERFTGRANDYLMLTSRESKIVEPYLELLNKTAFLAEENDRIENLKFVIGLNRPRSLSSKKNYLLYKELNAEVQSDVEYSLLGFFWDYPWVKFNRDENGKLIKNKIKKRKKISYSEVLNFYRQLKKKNPEAAKDFRIKNEKENRGMMIPYRSIRELIKNHEETQRFVREIREVNQDSLVYLFITDSDTTNFNACFDSYSKVSREERPDVMTSGYYFDSSNRMVGLASDLDMNVRIVTAKTIPMGVYFPEPSLCLLVPIDFDTVPESFEKLTPTKKVSKAFYGMPGESKKIMKHIEEARENPIFKFLRLKRLFTKAPVRALKNKKGGDLTFKAKYNTEKEIFENWVFKDLINITKNSAQSHAYSKSWATNLMDAFELETKLKFGVDNINKFKGKPLSESLVRQIVISLLSRLFNSYDPITLAKKNKNKLFRILRDYDNFVSTDTIDKYVPRKRRTHSVWGFVDNIVSRDDLLTALSKLIKSKLIKNFDVGFIDETCRNVGKTITSFLLEKFDFDDIELESKFSDMNIFRKN